MKNTSSIWLLGYGISAFVLCGCISLKTVKVSASPEIAAASVRVDVAPASSALKTVSLREYWQPGNSVRSAASAKTVHFGPGQSSQQDISTAGWKGKEVVVLADLPGSQSDSALRQTIPTNKA